jgi:ribosome-binding protein aMBF1 (putative translation factor)
MICAVDGKGAYILTKEQIEEVRKRHKDGASQCELADHVKFDVSNISRLLAGKTTRESRKR